MHGHMEVVKIINRIRFNGIFGALIMCGNNLCFYNNSHFHKKCPTSHFHASTLFCPDKKRTTAQIVEL